MISLLYPEHCITCDAPLEWVCSSCIRRIAWLMEPRAAKPLPSGRGPVVSTVLACASYTDPVWQACIRAVKYEQMHVLTPRLKHMIKSWREVFHGWMLEEGEGYAIVPVPTNPAHLLERGRDHMDVWSDVFASLLPNACVRRDLALRTTSDHAHAKFVLEASREEAAQEVFTLTGTVPEKVVLVDDVYTSGATLQTLARLFQEQGTREVQILVAAIS